MSRKSEFRTPGNFFSWNLESWALESGIQLKEYRTLLKIGIQNPNFTNKDRNPVPGIRNLGRGIQNQRLSWIPLHRVTTPPLACSPTPLPKNKKKEKEKALGIDAVVVVFVFASRVSWSESEKENNKCTSAFETASVTYAPPTGLVTGTAKVSRGSLVSGLVS